MRFYHLLQFLVILLIIEGCRKEEKPVNADDSEPEVQTVILNKHGRKFNCTGSILSPGSSQILEKGICWDTLPNPTLDDYKAINNFDTNLFSCELVGLNPDTKYFVRAYALNKSGISFGKDLVLTTEALITLVVGDDYQGGRIGYLFKLGDLGYKEGEVHGVIVATIDQSDSVIWGGDTYDYIGAGKLNTENSVKRFGLKKTAARICYDLVLNGYNDWYLPCQFEFYLVSPNWDLIGNFKTDKFYWTSNEFYNPFSSPNGPYYFHFKNGKFVDEVFDILGRYDYVKMNARAFRTF
jgi:hypothetical protein